MFTSIPYRAKEFKMRHTCPMNSKIQINAQTGRTIYKCFAAVYTRIATKSAAIKAAHVNVRKLLNNTPRVFVSFDEKQYHRVELFTARQIVMRPKVVYNEEQQAKKCGEMST